MVGALAPPTMWRSISKPYFSITPDSLKTKRKGRWEGSLARRSSVRSIDLFLSLNNLICGWLLHAKLSLHLFEQGHIMSDGNRHVGFLRLLLDKTPLDTEIVVGEQAVLAEARPGEIERAERILFRCAGPIHKNFDRLLGIRLQELQASQGCADSTFDQVGISFDLIFLHAETGNGIGNDFRCIAEEAITPILHLNVRRQGHQAALDDVFLHSRDARRGRAHRQQLILALLQA